MSDETKRTTDLYSLLELTEDCTDEELETMNQEINKFEFLEDHESMVSIILPW